MAPSEDDNAPKAPDKSEKTKCEKSHVVDNAKEKDKDEKSLSNLNDGELKALLDEAMNYKNPKDREGKSKLFKDLLHQAEETERIARAASAGGSELVRHCNPSARGAGGRGRRSTGGGAGRLSGGSTGGGQRSGGAGGSGSGKRASAAERHGGSLDDLAKEELYVRSAARQLVGAAGGRQAQQNRRTVSARQREGGSLPCDVNSSVPARDCQFLEEARKSKALKNREYTSIDIDSLETECLLDHDILAQNYQEAQQEEVTVAPRYTSRATLQISATPVDDPIPLDLETAVDKKPYDLESLQNKVSHSEYNVYTATYHPKTEEKKVDENGNALHQSSSAKAKKKKIQVDKNVVVLAAEKVEGHRGDIINDVDKLIQYIAGDKDEKDSSGKRYNVHKSKQLHKQHTTEDGPRSKKQRAHSKGKESRSELKKSNSLGEISTSKLDDFAFSTRDEKDEDQVVLRPNKTQSDRPKERRSWGNVEPPLFQILSNSASIENLETSDNWEVTKPKKKNKKRRNSISSNRRQNSTSDSFAKQHNRAPSPDLRGKSACSVPHSERSNDSSDADSVHSLPIDGLNHQISYADIAKNREKKLSPEKQEKIGGAAGKEKTVVTVASAARVECDLKYSGQAVAKNKVVVVEKQIGLTPVINNVKVDIVPLVTKPQPPPDVNNPRAFPAIPSDPKAPPDVHSPKAFPAIAEPPKNGPQPPPSVCDVPKGGVSPPASLVAASPPDFSNPKSFPAISKSGSGSMASGTSVKTKNAYTSAIRVGGGATSTTGTVKSATNSVNKGAGAVSVSTCVVQCDIQNDLSIIHSNEKDSIQHNAQMLPANIPDVRTIEQMHFLQRNAAAAAPASPVVQAVSPAEQQRVQSPVPAPAPTQPQQQQAQTRRQQPHHQHHNHCDNERPTTIAGSNSSAESEDGSSSCGGMDNRPPVVIMSSGAASGNKEVPDLVFGFDINEQLLHESACESFVARWVAPETYTFHSHNHDKIVNFIGSAWEAIVNQSNGKVQYYKEES
ncbi:unnamed protein product [Acanthoscelides obtectus]|uniref:Uncharacterized protein n=1 Tax=Acanthoscelides obtectus TaxID=200917 RepID=A0A9P0KU66_ACAOB|nr:unnamed protein product [Acanthoscelides obtectus]CAK1645649.1 hypothetical protein AOBTE_LOCUS14192 [Acanthoscelides obtectus]